ncbi:MULTISPECIES: hypothetical protein [unclassified Variovorax]|uniref:hypothetical protein n=1 Tax=unclassified Variovorax TaxID=663243 RepID=UPI003F4663E3
MSTLSKRDAALLVAGIRNAHVSGHTIAARAGCGQDSAMGGFLGGLESVLVNFLRVQGCHEAAAAIAPAMNNAPTEAEIAACNARIDGYRTKATGSAA